MLDSAALLDLYQQGRAADALTRAGLLGRLVAGDGDEAGDEAGALSLAELDRRIWALHRQLAGSGPSEAVGSCPACGARLEFSLPGDFAPPAAPEHPAEPVAVAWRGESYLLRLPRLADFGPEGLRPENLGAAPWQDPEFTAHAAEALRAADPALALTLAMNCPECGAALDEIFDPVAFLWAEIEDMARDLLREVIGLARAFGWSEAEILAMPRPRRLLYLAELAEPMEEVP
ncbi:MAG TPA: hypothetical protein PLI13_14755 [Paracoccus sp. (in: a-proteobacteria)]|nr:hypothetical protein [Paracoccus sp. (in: a-proteobacteria)]